MGRPYIARGGDPPFTSTSLSLDQQGHLQGRLPPGQHHLPQGPLPGHTLHRRGRWSLCGRGGGAGGLHVPERPWLVARRAWHPDAPAPPEETMGLGVTDLQEHPGPSRPPATAACEGGLPGCRLQGSAVPSRPWPPGPRAKPGPPPVSPGCQEAGEGRAAHQAIQAEPTSGLRLAGSSASSAHPGGSPVLPVAPSPARPASLQRKNWR